MKVITGKKYNVDTEIEVFFEGSTVKYLKVNRVTLTPHVREKGHISKKRVP